MNQKTVLSVVALIAVALVFAAMVGHGLFMRVVSGSTDIGPFVYGEQGYVGLLLSVATAAGAGISVWALLRQNRLAAAALEQNRLGEVATRFQKGVELITHESGATKLAGVYLLRDVAVEEPRRYRSNVIALLMEYARADSRSRIDEIDQVARLAEGPDDEKYHAAAQLAQRPTEPHIVAAVGTAGRLRHAQNKVGDDQLPRLDFGGIVLFSCALEDCNFSPAWFYGAKLVGVRFVRCNLEEAAFNLGRDDDISFLSCSARRCDITDETTRPRLGQRHVYAMSSDFTDATISGLNTRVNLTRCLVDHLTATRSEILARACWVTSEDSMPDFVAAVAEVQNLRVATEAPAYEA